MPKEIQPLRGFGFSVVVRSTMKYWRLRYVCVDFDTPHPPTPHTHLSSAPAPTANSHQSQDFTLRVRSLFTFRFTHCVLLSQRVITVHPVLFSLLIYSRGQRVRQSHSRLRSFLTSHQWKRMQVIFGEPRRVWLTGRHFCCCAQVLPKKHILLEYKWVKCQFLLNQGRSSVTDDMSAI